MQVMPSIENNWEKQGKNSVITYFPLFSCLNQVHAHFIKIVSRSVCLYLSTYLCPYALTHVSKPFKWQKQPLYKKYRLNKAYKLLIYK